MSESLFTAYKCRIEYENMEYSPKFCLSAIQNGHCFNLPASLFIINDMRSQSREPILVVYGFMGLLINELLVIKPNTENEENKPLATIDWLKEIDCDKLIEKYLTVIVPKIRSYKSDPQYPIVLKRGNAIYDFIIGVERHCFPLIEISPLFQKLTEREQSHIRNYLSYFDDYISIHYGRDTSMPKDRTVSVTIPACKPFVFYYSLSSISTQQDGEDNPDSITPIEYVKSKVHQLDSLLSKRYTPQWMNEMLEEMQEDEDVCFHLQRKEKKVSDCQVFYCIGAMRAHGIFGTNRSRDIVETLGLNSSTQPLAKSVTTYLDRGGHNDVKYYDWIQKYIG